MIKSHVTPYEMSKLVNEITGRNLPPQMFYNYIRKGFIQTEVVGTKKLVPITECQRWLDKYTKKNVNV